MLGGLLNPTKAVILQPTPTYISAYIQISNYTYCETFFEIRLKFDVLTSVKQESIALRAKYQITCSRGKVVRPPRLHWSSKRTKEKRKK
jgi:hypothetical protein